MIDSRNMLNEEELEAIEDMQIEIGMLVASGFLTREEILAVASDEPLGLDHDKIADMVNTAYDAKLEDEKSWPDVTDFDRLCAAFDALESEGFLCLHNPDYTPSGAEYAANVAWEQAGGGKSGKWAILYYHTQDIEYALEAKSMSLCFAAVADHPVHRNSGEPTGIAGMRVVKALQDQGLTVTWDGNIDRCIELSLTWQKRHITSPVPKPAVTVLKRDEDWTFPEDGMIRTTPETIRNLFSDDEEMPPRILN